MRTTPVGGMAFVALACGLLSALGCSGTSSTAEGDTAESSGELVRYGLDCPRQEGQCGYDSLNNGFLCTGGHWWPEPSCAGTNSWTNTCPRWCMRDESGQTNGWVTNCNGELVSWCEAGCTDDANGAYCLVATIKCQRWCGKNYDGSTALFSTCDGESQPCPPDYCVDPQDGNAYCDWVPSGGGPGE